MTTGKVKRTKLEMEGIFADVEDHVIRLRQEGRVRAALMAKYGVDRTTVSRWMREVFERLKASAPHNEQREDRRNLMRATLDTVMSMALNKTVTLRDVDGKPVIDPNTGKPHKIASPDLKNALAACKQLRDLDGLDAPIKVEATVDGKTTTTLVLGDEDRRAVEAALKGLR